MLTPEQLESVSFAKKFGGGYNTEEVDSFLEPLLADYITLYNENSSLRSKMRVLVTKLEEYRSAEISMQEAMISTQKNCDAQLAEAAEKCASMIQDAEIAAIEADRKIAAEENRVEQARLFAARQINEMKEQFENCIRILSDIESNHRPSSPIEAEPAVKANPANTEKPIPRDPMADKFANLQFGRNYDPDKR